MRLILWFSGLSALLLGSWLIWGGRLEQAFTLEGSVEWLESAGSWAWAAGVLLLLADFILPVPGTVVISALGYIYGVAVGGAVGAAGMIGGGLLGYGAGRLLGASAARRWLGDGDFDKGKRLFSQRGGWMVVLSRALPILPEVISCMAGVVRMPFKRFLVALACGSVPMAFLFAAIGMAGHETPRWALAFSVAVPAVLWWLASRISHRD